MSIDAMKQALDAFEEINKLSVGENAICLPAEIDGAKNPRSRLTEEQARVVKYSGRPLKELAAEFGVSFGCVDKSRYGQTWRHL